MSIWQGAVSGWSWSFGSSFNWFGHAESVLLSLLDWLPFKQSSPFSTALLKHYVERSGDAYTLATIPGAWQAWIIKATGGRPGMHRNLNPYNSGLYDLRNSLGHFDVEVKINNDGTKTYAISKDSYHFGFIPNDKTQRGRHGFPLGNLGEWETATIRDYLPQNEYMNPGGFKERWEIETVNNETILFIPQKFHAKKGTLFKVTGSFTR